MTELEIHQRGLLNLIKSRAVAPNDPYLRHVANSRELAMLREIALWWRAFQIETRCRFTSRLLKRLDLFRALVEAYFNNSATSPFVEDLSRDFLLSLSHHPAPLVRSVSQFERAFLETRAGSPEAFEVLWDRNPDILLRALEESTALPELEPRCVYRMQIARDLPQVFACSCEVVVNIP